MIVGGGAWVVFHQPFVYPFALGFEILNTKAYVGVKLFMTSAIFMNEKVKSTAAAADFLTLWHCTHTSQRTWCTSLSRETQIILLKFFGCTNSKTLKAAAVLRESRLNSWHFTRQEKRVNYLLLMLHFSFLQQRWRSQNQNFVPSKKEVWIVWTNAVQHSLQYGFPEAKKAKNQELLFILEVSIVLCFTSID